MGEKLLKCSQCIFGLLFLLSVPPLVLIYLQPDLGTTIIIGVVWLVMVPATPVPPMTIGWIFHCRWVTV